ncbi:Predicted membrane protein [Paenibacillus sp. 1_12]|uniref:DUF2306 domain-containing protein n=1 Tax=Paenibacillus sp. 1_12 TaxID=1566278 RepID=UPI0008F239C9|nr:DUF2306 domain-containing protein [Paenibacillus sp. 1_12]SFL36957.1 Predicted membrane protein [Paenibacillus sp. 1_12]
MGEKVIRALVFVLSFAIAGYAIVQYGVFAAHHTGLVGFKLQKPDFHLTPWLYVLYAHIVTATLALIIGPFQIFMKQSKARVRQHRLLGYVYVVSITVSGIVNLYLTLFATGGWIAGLGFFVLDVLWVATTWMALRKIRVKNIQAHKAWMLRSYALTFAAVTLRIWLGPVTMLFGDFEQAYRVIAWLCWVPNLLVIEAMIRAKAAKKKPPAASI